MDFYDLKNAFLVGVFMAFMIGPVFFMLLKTSILKGARAAIAFDVGVILGDISFMLIAYFGSRSLLIKIKDDPRLFLIGGFVLVIYGLITFFDKKNKKENQVPEVTLSATNNYLKLLIKGFFLNFINIGVLAFWLGLIVVIGPTYDMNPKYLFWYFATVILGYALTDLAKILLAKQLKKKLTALVIYRIKRGMGVLLIVFGAALMLKSFIPKDKIDNLLNILIA
ncbi:LysE family translocator [Tenacibaculum piscium]|uniref:Lysine transporter LysE n=1 Tax=Tenacibaculum piscium TaxID=1458515 RepID=A0A2H1YKE4_9FLAO|nr:LysE family transporter [Tenacibaculum piscium]MBE7629230.1 LysE family transporter [Tenacibaculum piscium]MBE7670017.1 LysE family transporter [Tenacibaculum piscium]MBE7690142.1 LysE family transporter [Tenacibaculum piscium]SOS75979.1 Lysine transporter LysE [Tenacibaculum piscium]